tara:strand:- start:896 stop:1168 length:273 start_codon:yes stop_codon:yes gene_type:complete
MGQLVLNYPDEHEDRILDAICSLYGYRLMVDGPDGELIENPDSPAVFVRKRISNWVKRQVVAREKELASEGIDEAIEQEVMSIDIDFGEE